MNRRNFLKLSSLFTPPVSLPLLQACNKKRANNPNQPLTIGYLPITDSAPLLVAHAQEFFAKRNLTVLQPILFRSFAQLVEAFLSGQVNLIHILSPMTIWLRYGSLAAIKVVMWNHISGSALTVSPTINTVAELSQKHIAIPFWYSIHNVVLQALLRNHNLTVTEQRPKHGQVKLSVVSPPDMVAGLAANSIDGFIVADPFNASAELKDIGKILRFTSDIWKDHACCLTLMHEDDLINRPKWSQKVIDSLVEATLWIKTNRQETAKILAVEGANKYTPHPLKVLNKVLSPAESDYQFYVKTGAIHHPKWQQQRIDFQPYPYPSYLEKLVNLLKQTFMPGDNAFLTNLDAKFVAQDLVDNSFVKKSITKLNAKDLFKLDNYHREELIVV